MDILEPTISFGWKSVKEYIDRNAITNSALKIPATKKTELIE
jgi:hypothetical protein